MMNGKREACVGALLTRHACQSMVARAALLALFVVGSLFTSLQAQAAPGIYLAVDSIASNSVSVSWTSLGLSGVTEYRVYYGWSSSSMYNYVSCPASNSKATVPGLSSSTTYYIKVRAIYAGGQVDSTARLVTTLAFSPTTPPAAPSSLVGSALSASSIKIAWTDNASTETGFRVERAPSADGPWTQIYAAKTNSISYTDTALSSATVYFYRVAAYNGIGSSSYSNTVAIGTLSGPPATPTGLSGSLVAAGQVSLTWADNATNEASYKVERAGSSLGPWAQLATIAADSKGYIDASIGSMTSAYYRVRAVNSAGNSSYSNVATVITYVAKPATPIGLIAAAASASQVNLTWTDASNNETGFKLEQSAVAIGPWTQVADLPVGSKNVAVTGLGSGTRYYFRVCAYNMGGSSYYSNVANATTQALPPADPSGLQAVAVSTSQINLVWSDNSNNETGFEIERAIGTTGQFALVASVSAGVSSYSNTGLAGSTPYRYRVRAVNAGGGSDYTNIASASTGQTAPMAPSGLSASASVPGQIGLLWLDNSSDETRFRIERAAASGGPFEFVADVGAGVMSYTDTGCAAGITYFYRVAAENSVGRSTYSNTASATTPCAVPDAPTGPSASAVSTTQILLGWSDNSPNETGFKVERGTNAGGPFVQISTVGAGVTSFTDSALSSETTYFYRVRATNACGDSVYLGVASATTLPNVPTAPSNLSGMGVSANSVNLSWWDNSSSETGFRVDRATSSTGPFVEVKTLGAGVVAYTDTGLVSASTYYYRVCAIGAAGVSGYSNTASAMTSGVGPAAPSNLVGSPASATRVDLSWKDNSGNETGFRIEKSLAENGPFTYLASVGAGVSTYADLYVTASKTYYYRVCAYNTVANSDYSNTVTVSTITPAPITPSSLVATPLSTSEIKLAWFDGAVGEMGMKIERSASASGPFVEVANVGANTSEWTNSGLVAGTTYYYRVCAYNSGGNSPYSNTASAMTKIPLPAGPTALSAVAVSAGQINLAWADNATNESDYRVERSSSVSGPFVEVATLGAGTVSWSDTGRAAPASYFYRVKAHNSTGDSAYSNVVGANTAIPAPAGLTVISRTEYSLNLVWNPVQASIDGYKIERASAALGPYSQIALVTSPSYSNAGLFEDTTYYYRVSAYNSLGSSSASETFGTTKLKAPSNLTATHISDTEIDLAWVDNSVMETNIVLERSVAGVWSVLVTLPANTTAYSDKTCVHDSYYEYRVKAIGSVSDYSNTLPVQTLSKPLPNPELVGFLSDLGSIGDVTVAGTMAYVASDPFGVVVVDVTNPAAPYVIGSQHPAGPASQIAVSGGVAVAVGTPRGTDIVDVRDPVYPRVATSISGNAVDVATSGNFAYLASGGDLKVVDITNPYSAYVTSTVITPGSAYGVAVSGNRAVIADATKGVSVVDITNPYAPCLLGNVQLTGTAWKAAVSGNTAYVTTSYPVSLVSVDISVPSSPRVLGVIYPCNGAFDVTLSGGYAFLSADASGMFVVDIANPSAMRIVAQYDTSQVRCLPNGCDVKNGKLYTASFGMGLFISDLSNIASLSPVGSAVQTSNAYKIGYSTSANAAVIAGTTRGTEIIDLSTPDYPRVAKTFTERSSDVATSGNFAYLASGGDLKVVDITNPYSAYVTSTVITPGSAYGVAVSGNRAVIADATKGVSVVDISNPYAPRLLGNTQLVGTAWKAAVSGNTAYVTTSYPVSLVSVDISVPSSPRVLGVIYPCNGAFDVTISGGYAFLSADASGMFVVDIANPSAMRIVAQYQTGLINTLPQSCVLQGDFLYIAGGGMGMKVLDIENIEMPRIVGTYNGPGSCQDIAVGGDLIVTADSKSGIGVFTK